MRAALHGHRLLPHTADVIVEAWGPSRDACLRQAVLGLVAVFADVTHVAVSACVPFHLPPDGDEDLLLALLEEVLYLLDAEGVIPVNATITTAADGGLRGEFLVAPAAAIDQHGAVPKAISYHGLELREHAGTWHCQVTIDV